MRSVFEIYFPVLVTSVFFLLFPAGLSAQLPDPAELNTAADGTATTFPVGSQDANWTVAYGDDSGPVSPFVPATVVGSCSNFWYTSPLPNVDWISYDFNNPSGNACEHEEQGCTDLFFRREIVLPAATDCGQPIEEAFCLGLDFFADNAVYEIWVNDVSNYQYNLPDDPYDYVGYVDPTSVNLCDGWQAGVNFLMVQTKSCPSSQGFLAQASLEIDNDYFFPFEQTVSICEGETFAGYDAAGVYVDTLLYPEGCDTIRTLNLTVLPVPASELAAEICEGESFEGYTQTGVYIDTLQAANGCDSIRTLDLTVLPVATSGLAAEICEGENFEGYTQTGVYVDTLQAANGCDSIRSLNLTVFPTVTSVVGRNICPGDSFEGYSESGVYLDTLLSANGCDSIRTLYLTVISEVLGEELVRICAGESYNGYTQSGTYVDTLQTQTGCDSIHILDLIVEENVRTQREVNLCTGESYDFNGRPISEAGTYQDTLLTAAGCDSILILTVRITESDFLGEDVVICTDESVTLTGPSDETLWFDGRRSRTAVVSETGLYWARLTDVEGCELVDSVFVQFNARAYVPNIFSPNNDGFNDDFGPFFSDTDFSSYSMQVYDRWGGSVFITENVEARWDGTRRGDLCPQGVYLYFVTFENEACGAVLLRGEVNLVR